MKPYGEWMYRSTFSWPRHYTALPPDKQPFGTDWIGGWVGLRSGVNDVEKRKFLTLPGLELRAISRSARNQSLYRLCYPWNKNEVPSKSFSEFYERKSFFILTYSRSWALLEEPLIVQPLRNFPAFYGTRRLNTVFTRALHWSLSWTISIQSTPSHPIWDPF
jgi:hypothetical protein